MQRHEDYMIEKQELIDEKLEEEKELIGRKKSYKKLERKFVSSSRKR